MYIYILNYLLYICLHVYTHPNHITSHPYDLHLHHHTPVTPHSSPLIGKVLYSHKDLGSSVPFFIDTIQLDPTFFEPFECE